MGNAVLFDATITKSEEECKHMEELRDLLNIKTAIFCSSIYQYVNR